MGFSVKTHRLATSLEKAIGETDSLISGIPEKDRLRYSVCGLVATAISSYAQNEGFDSYLLASSPKLPFDPEMTHVIPVLALPSDSNQPTRVAIDAAPSQFLDYAGLSPYYDRETGQKIMPSEKVVVFDLDNPYPVVRWLVKSLERFHATDVQDDKLGMGPTPLLYSERTEQESLFNQIYAQKNLQPWTPSDKVLETAVDMASTLPSGLIVNK